MLKEQRQNFLQQVELYLDQQLDAKDQLSFLNSLDSDPERMEIFVEEKKFRSFVKEKASISSASQILKSRIRGLLGNKSE